LLFTSSSPKVQSISYQHCLESSVVFYYSHSASSIVCRFNSSTPQPFHRRSTVEFVSGLVINGNLSSGLWDFAACNGNWITAAEVDRLGSVRESAKVQVYTSPLFPDRTFTSRHVVYLDIDFPTMGFSILQTMCHIMEEMQAQAPIIFGQDLISMYGILNYIIKPDKYCAVQPPAQAPEEFLDNDEH